MKLIIGPGQSNVSWFGFATTAETRLRRACEKLAKSLRRASSPRLCQCANCVNKRTLILASYSSNLRKLFFISLFFTSLFFILLFFIFLTAAAVLSCLVLSTIKMVMSVCWWKNTPRFSIYISRSVHRALDQKPTHSPSLSDDPCRVTSPVPHNSPLPPRVCKKPVRVCKKPVRVCKKPVRVCKNPSVYVKNLSVCM